MSSFFIWPENWEELGLDFPQGLLDEDEPLPPGWVYVNAEMLKVIRQKYESRSDSNGEKGN